MLLKEALQSQEVLRTSVLVLIMFNYRFAFCLHKPLQLIGRERCYKVIMVLLPVVVLAASSLFDHIHQNQK